MPLFRLIGTALLFSLVLLVLYLPSTNKLMNETILPIALPSIFQSRTQKKNKVRRVREKRRTRPQPSLSGSTYASVCVDLSIHSGKKFILFLSFFFICLLSLHVFLRVQPRRRDVVCAPCMSIGEGMPVVCDPRRKKKKNGRSTL